MSEESLIATIKGEFTPTRNIELGLAYHTILERPDKFRVLWGGYECRGFKFTAGAIDSMLERIGRGGVFEVKAQREIDGCVLVAKADHMSGAHLSEFKTTLDTFDPDKYLGSLQWRVMAWLFEPEILTYRVALLSEQEEQVELRAIEDMDLYPYAKVEEDIRYWLRLFVHYVKVRKLDGLLAERQRIAEARAS